MKTFLPLHRPGRQNRTAALLAERLGRSWIPGFLQEDARIELNDHLWILVQTNGQLCYLEQQGHTSVRRPTTWGAVTMRVEGTPVLH